MGRILEFVEREEAKPKLSNDDSQTTSNGKSAENGTEVQVVNTADGSLPWKVRVNWLYRPKDISHKMWDSRQLYVTMHSDVCPLHSLRGKCIVMAKSEIIDFDAYLQTPDCFWFDKFWDRYMQRMFEFVPTTKIINIPLRMQKLLQERFKFAILESTRAKDLTEEPKNCHGCTEWCSPDDSVQCADCKNHYHMMCVDPPLTRKPTRGFGWACAICSHQKEEEHDQEIQAASSTRSSSMSRSAERYLNSVTDSQSVDSAIKHDNDDDSTISKGLIETEIAEVKREDMDTAATGGEEASGLAEKSSVSPSPSPEKTLCRYEEFDHAIEHANLSLSAAQKKQLQMWPFRYMGIHVKVEDTLDLDDRIYPKASTRLGSKYQAVVPEWHGHSTVFVTAAQAGSANGGSKAKKRGSKTPQPASHASGGAEKKFKMEPWMQVKPAGYVERGGDATSTLMWKNKPNETGSDELSPDEDKKLEEYLVSTHQHAEELDMSWRSANYIDMALKAYMDCGYDQHYALGIVGMSTRRSLKEPTLKDDEKKRFEDAVRIYGSELHPVTKAVRTKNSATIVRYYYLWKKTPAGRQIWGNYEGRRKNKHRAVDGGGSGVGIEQIAHSVDDSAFETSKAVALQRHFSCKFCGTSDCTQWRKAPGGVVGIASTVQNGIESGGGAIAPESAVLALCFRCARLWRKYAVQWLDPLEVYQLLHTKTGSAWRQRVEYELVDDARAIFTEIDKAKKRQKITSAFPLSSLIAPPIGSNASETVADRTTSSPTSSTKKRKKVPIEETESQCKKSKKELGSSQSSRSATPDVAAAAAAAKPTKSKTEKKKAASTTETASTKVATTKAASNEQQRPLSGNCRVCQGSKPTVQCRTCQLSVHRECYGNTADIEEGTWICEVCLNEYRTPRHARYDYQCVLCPLSHAQNIDVLKPTRQSRHWAHLRCALWVDGITLSPDRTVENIAMVNRTGLVQQCDVCRSSETGYCITCPVCNKRHVHVGCVTLQRDRFTLGFLNKKPVVLCRDHGAFPADFVPLGSPQILSDLNSYCNTFKRTNITAVGPRRKALLLSAALEKDRSSKPPGMKALPPS